MDRLLATCQKTSRWRSIDRLWWIRLVHWATRDRPISRGFSMTRYALWSGNFRILRLMNLRHALVATLLFTAPLFAQSTANPPAAMQQMILPSHGSNLL